MKLFALLPLFALAVSCPAAEMLTPKPGPAPALNGPRVYGSRPGRPFLYRIPCTGERPMRFSAKGLPKGLRLDTQTGIISGAAPRERGGYLITLRAANAKGSAERKLKLVVGDTLALTPPMGWNHWYTHYHSVTDSLFPRRCRLLWSNRAWPISATST